MCATWEGKGEMLLERQEPEGRSEETSDQQAGSRCRAGNWKHCELNPECPQGLVCSEVAPAGRQKAMEEIHNWASHLEQTLLLYSWKCRRRKISPCEELSTLVIKSSMPVSSALSEAETGGLEIQVQPGQLSNSRTQ